MAANLYNMPTGVAGDITRVDESSVEPAKLIAVSSVFAQKFGIAMKYATGGISQMGAGDAATAFAGILVREVPSISGNTNQGYDDNTPNPNQIAGLLVRGYAAVKCTVGTPVRGGVVYVRVVEDGVKKIGDFEATADSTNSVALTNAQASWAADGKDAENNAEIRVAR